MKTHFRSAAPPSPSARNALWWGLSIKNIVVLVALQVVGSLTCQMVWGEAGRVGFHWTSLVLLSGWMYFQVLRFVQASKQASVSTNNAATTVQVKVVLPQNTPRDQ